MADQGRLIYDMPRDQYDRIDRLNWSRLKHMARSAATFLWQTMHPDEEDTDARKLGRCTHVAVYEPTRYPKSVAVWDGGRRSGKDWDKFCETFAGSELLTEKEAEFIKGISGSVRSDATAAKYVSGGRGEVTLLFDYAVDFGDGTAPIVVPCKARLDFEAEVRALVDLKTTLDASPTGFGRQVHEYRYDGQAAFYADAYAAVTGRRWPYVFVAAEKKPPYLVGVYPVTPNWMTAGRDHYRALLHLYARCKRDNHWPGYGDGELVLEAPRWSPAFEDPEDVTGMGLEISNHAEEAIR